MFSPGHLPNLDIFVFLDPRASKTKTKQPKNQNSEENVLIWGPFFLFS